MKRILAFGIAALAVALVAATALARGHLHREAFLKSRVTAHIDEALDAAKASPTQRAAIVAASDRAFAALAANRPDGRAHMEKAIALFESDHLAPEAVQALRAEHDAALTSASDAIVQALTEAHNVLNPTQRK